MRKKLMNEKKMCEEIRKVGILLKWYNVGKNKNIYKNHD